MKQGNTSKVLFWFFFPLSISLCRNKTKFQILLSIIQAYYIYFFPSTYRTLLLPRCWLEVQINESTGCSTRSVQLSCLSICLWALLPVFQTPYGTICESGMDQGSFKENENDNITVEKTRQQSQRYVNFIHTAINFSSSINRGWFWWSKYCSS